MAIQCYKHEVKPVSHFRIWLNKIWCEHKQEVFDYTGVVVTDDQRSDYIRRNRWFLKALYQGKV